MGNVAQGWGADIETCRVIISAHFHYRASQFVKVAIQVFDGTTNRVGWAPVDARHHLGTAVWNAYRDAMGFELELPDLPARSNRFEPDNTCFRDVVIINPAKVDLIPGYRKWFTEEARAALKPYTHPSIDGGCENHLDVVFYIDNRGVHSIRLRSDTQIAGFQHKRRVDTDQPLGEVIGILYKKASQSHAKAVGSRSRM